MLWALGYYVPDVLPDRSAGIHRERTPPRTRKALSPDFELWTEPVPGSSPLCDVDTWKNGRTD